MSSRLAMNCRTFCRSTATLQGFSTSTNLHTSPTLHYYYCIIFFEHGKVLLHATHEALLFGGGLCGLLPLLWRAIDATPARWRAVLASSPVDGASTAVSSPSRRQELSGGDGGFRHSGEQNASFFFLGFFLALEPNQDDDFFLTGLSGDMSPRASDVEFFVRIVGAASSPARRFDCGSGT